MPNYNLDVSDSETRLANLTNYYAFVQNSANRRSGNIIVTVTFVAAAPPAPEKTVTFEIEPTNLQVRGNVIGSLGGNVTVQDTSYNRMSGQVGQVNMGALTSALNHFCAPITKHGLDRKHLIVMIFFLSEAARSEAAYQTAIMAMDIEAYCASFPLLSQAHIGARLSWDYHHVIFSNWNSMRQTVVPVPLYLTVANMRIYSAPRAHQTQKNVGDSLNSMGF